MAKGQKRSTREAKKPKQKKPAAPAGSPLSTGAGPKRGAPVPEKRK